MAPPILSADEVEYARELREWRERRGLSKKALAAAMAYDPSRVSHIEGGRQAPTEEFTRQAEAALQAGGAPWARWEAIAASRFGLTSRPIERDLRTPPFIAWLADHSDASFGSLYAAVNAAVARLEAEPPSLRYGREHHRRHVSRAQLAEAIARYYGEPPAGSMLYRAKVGDRRLTTSILTRPEWLDTAVPLGGDAEYARFVPPGPDKRPGLTSAGLAAAVQRLAGVEVNGTVMVNNPLYQLLDVDVAPGELSATFTTVDFGDHALTTELIEGELIAAIGQSRDGLPLRDAYLPTIDATFELGQRACVGGVVSLLAIARRRGDVRDYVLFTQERSSTVLNLAGKLATIPKGFHQPTGEPTHEVRPSSTVRREFEEELLGRQELEQIESLPHSHWICSTTST